MKTVQITSGGYGYRERQAPHPVDSGGEFVCLPDDEADRLAALGVADCQPEAQPEIEPQKNAPATKRTRKSKAATA